MTAIILQPCGNKDARKHYVDTMQNPVPLRQIKPFILPAEYSQLKIIYPDELVRVWGVTAGKTGSNKRKWDRISVGDVTLLSADGRIFASAVTTFKLHNKNLAADLWDYNNEGETWDIFTLLPRSQNSTFLTSLLIERWVIKTTTLFKDSTCLATKRAITSWMGSTFGAKRTIQRFRLKGA